MNDKSDSPQQFTCSSGETGSIPSGDFQFRCYCSTPSPLQLTFWKRPGFILLPPNLYCTRFPKTSANIIILIYPPHQSINKAQQTYLSSQGLLSNFTINILLQVTITSCPHYQFPCAHSHSSSKQNDAIKIYNQSRHSPALYPPMTSPCP